MNSKSKQAGVKAILGALLRKLFRKNRKKKKRESSIYPLR